MYIYIYIDHEFIYVCIYMYMRVDLYVDTYLCICRSIYM